MRREKERKKESKKEKASILESLFFSVVRMILYYTQQSNETSYNQE